MLYDNQQKYQTMKIKLLLAISVFALFCNATDDSNGSGKKRIDLSDSSPTFPHMIDVAEPVAMYTISTAMIDIIVNTSSLPNGQYVMCLMHNNIVIQSLNIYKTN